MTMEPFAKTAALVQQGLEQGAYPSACLSVGIGPRVLCRRTFGHVTGHTLYDMASVSKILGATMIALRWLEDGKLIPWMYHPAGRHVIEPADMVPLGDNYTAQVKIRWYDTDTGAVTRSQDDAADGLAVVSLDETEPDLPVSAPQFSITQKFIYMQTLTGYEGDPGSVLEVPKYVQAVDMGTENTLHEVDYIKIPDTVLYVNTKNYSEQPEGTQTAVKGITVKKGYIVDADSTAYAATADGILTNADGGAYLGIPYDMIELTVPENVEKVMLRERNYVVPEDVQNVFVDVCAHRLALRPQARVEGVAAKQVLEEIMAKIKPAHTEE